MLKVNSTLRQVIAEEVERLSDSRLVMVSITAVDTAPNLRHAVVYIDALGDSEAEEALAALRGASKRLQAVVGREVRMKYTPTLEFRVDPGVVAGDRIDAILRSLRTEEEE
jgi:ribosome-binding factor A